MTSSTLSRILTLLAWAGTLLGCGDSKDAPSSFDANPTIDAPPAPPPDAGVDAAIDATPPDAAPPSFVECGASDDAFVRSAYLAVLGQRPRSQAEVDVLTSMMAEVRELAQAGAADAIAEHVALDAMMRSPAFVDRWSEQLMDALQVSRIEVQNLKACYGKSSRIVTDGELAAFVRDNPASAGGDGQGPFTMRDLFRSALILDDISPVYRAHLFALMSRPIPAANVPPVEAELARRQDFGHVFDSVYLHRDLVCLGCHNSAFSTTQSPIAEQNRHFPMPGYLEEAIYGSHTGIEPVRAHAPFRVSDFVAFTRDGIPPWDWEITCGSFHAPDSIPPDPAGIDGLFASLSGQNLTVHDLEAALKRGFDELAQNGLPVEPDGSVRDPDAAFAYLVSASIVEAVWREVIGTPLTIATYFPRNEGSRDLLHELTDSFIASRFSLKELLTRIVMTPYFNRLPPEAGCGAGPYSMPAVYDPWVISDNDPARRLNGPADGVVPLSARTLLNAAYQALDWPTPYVQSFPNVPEFLFFCKQYSCEELETVCQEEGYCCDENDFLCVDPSPPEDPDPADEQSFQRSIGLFLKNGERGFRGLDFQARLMWEERFGTCRKYKDYEDFLDRLIAAAQSRDASVADVVLAIKDRLIGEAAIDSAGASGVSEAQAIEALFGAPMDTRVSKVAELGSKARAFCGVLLSSPQFLLSGIAARGGQVPVLTPEDASFAAVCAELASRGLPAGLALQCDSSTLALIRKP